jgi:ferredoxin
MTHRPWLIHILEKTFNNRFLFAKLTRVPWIGKLVYLAAFKDDHIVYLPRTDIVPVNRPLSNPGNFIYPSRIIEHFIHKAEYHWIMNFCICRESSGCRDYPIELGCLFMGEAVLKIDPKLGRLVTRQEALDHVQRCNQAGLVHLIGRNKLDTLWLKATPGEKLLTVCNCCPCCCLWKMLPNLNPVISSRISKLPGLDIRVTDRCKGCGTCTQNICFVKAISLENGRAVISSQCRGCGRCVGICPNRAIEIMFNEDTAIEKTIQSISTVVDIA